MPYPNEHAARLRDPGEFDPKSFRRVNGGTIFGTIKVPKTVAVIWGKLKGKAKPSDSVIPQALRFPVKNWTVAEARRWIKENNVKTKSFEPASKEKQGEGTYSERILSLSKNGGVAELPLGAFRCSEEEDLGVEDSRRDEGASTMRMKIVANSGREFSHWFWKKLVLDMSGARIGRQDKPLLRDHDPKRIAGATTRLWVDGRGRLMSEALLTGVTEDGREAIALTEEAGYPWQSSVYVPPKRVRLLNEGESVKVNGRKFEGPGAVFEDFEIREVSLCALGADENTSAAAMGEGGRTTIRFVLGGETETEEGMKVLEGEALSKLDGTVFENSEAVADEDPEETPEETPAEETPEETPEEETPEETPAEETPEEETPDEGEEASPSGGTQNVGLSGAAESVEDERERAIGIFSLAGDLGLYKLGEDLVREGASLEEATDKLKAAKLDSITDGAPKSPGPNETESPPSKNDPVSFEDEIQREWESSEETREEFGGSFDAFAAYRRAESKGLIKFYSREDESE